jgi:hypothetical protein
MLAALKWKRSLGTRTCSLVQGHAVGCGICAGGCGCGVVELSSQQLCEEFGLTGKVLLELLVAPVDSFTAMMSGSRAAGGGPRVQVNPHLPLQPPCAATPYCWTGLVDPLHSHHAWFHFVEVKLQRCPKYHAPTPPCATDITTNCRHMRPHSGTSPLVVCIPPLHTLPQARASKPPLPRQ